MLTVLFVLLAALIVVGAGECVRSACRQMINSPLQVATADDTKPALASV